MAMLFSCLSNPTSDQPRPPPADAVLRPVTPFPADEGEAVAMLKAHWDAQREAGLSAATDESQLAQLRQAAKQAKISFTSAAIALAAGATAAEITTAAYLIDDRRITPRQLYRKPTGGIGLFWQDLGQVAIHLPTGEFPHVQN